MGFLSKFEGKMEDTVEGAAERMGGSTLSPVQIAKKAEKQMRREKVVGAGNQYAPTLYTVLVSAEDDARMMGYYPTLAGETETFLRAKASELGLVMDGQPLVRFIADHHEAQKRGDGPLWTCEQLPKIRRCRNGWRGCSIACRCTTFRCKTSKASRVEKRCTPGASVACGRRKCCR